MIKVLLFSLAVISASFACSMAEAAILSLPLIRARILVDKKRINARDVLFLKEHISITVATIVIINNSINIIGAVFVGNEVARIFGDRWLATASGIFTFLIVVMGEMIPKALGERFKVPLSLFFAKPLRLLVLIFGPVVEVILLLVRPWTGKQGMLSVTEDEIKMMIKVGRDSGSIESQEEDLINQVFRLNDLTALQIMKPLKDVYSLPANKTLLEFKSMISASAYNRIVVYDKGDKTRIVGIVQHRVLLREILKDNINSKISEWMLKPIFVNQMMKADALLQKFQNLHQHLFVVQDNFGHNIGIVTMEDVLEELFGEIYDEKDIRFRMLDRQTSKTPKTT
jgi:CBS domain containing-hemolysin-like protein